MEIKQKHPEGWRVSMYTRYGDELELGLVDDAGTVSIDLDKASVQMLITDLQYYLSWREENA